MDFHNWICTADEDEWDDDFNDSEKDGNVRSQVTLAPIHPGWMLEDDGTTARIHPCKFERSRRSPTVILV